MSDGKPGVLGLELGRQQLLYGPRTLADLISTDVSGLHLDGAVTMRELADHQASEATATEGEKPEGAEGEKEKAKEEPSLKAIADAMRLRR